MASPTERWINTWRNADLYKIVADEFSLPDPDPQWCKWDRAYRVLSAMEDAGLTVVPEAEAKTLYDMRDAIRAALGSKK